MNEDKKKAFALDGSQWKGKLWYAYGTSITSTSYGQYAQILEEVSGMRLVNKGMPGEGLANFAVISTGQLFDAIFSDDGKENADLITLEVGPNDLDENAPLGDIFDEDRSTMCGCLNLAIRHLQEVTHAQVVIITSVAQKELDGMSKACEKGYLKFRDVAFINRCPFISSASGIGVGRMRNNCKYDTDGIHQTPLGGFNLALAIWSELKSIPLFYSK